MKVSTVFVLLGLLFKALADFPGKGVLDKEILGETKQASRHTMNLNSNFFAQWEGGCGGSLIHDDIILASAHCFQDAALFWFGEFYLGGEGIERSGDQVWLHPNWNNDTFENDFAIIKLRTSAVVDPLGQPTGIETVPINYDSSNPKEEDTLRYLGYGNQKYADSSVSLVDAEVAFVSDSQCALRLGDLLYPYVYSDDLLCASTGGAGVGHNPCICK